MDTHKIFGTKILVAPNAYLKIGSYFPTKSPIKKENIRLKYDHISTQKRTTISRFIVLIRFDSANVTLSALSIRHLFCPVNTILLFNFQNRLVAADRH